MVEQTVVAFVLSGLFSQVNDFKTIKKHQDMENLQNEISVTAQAI